MDEQVINMLTKIMEGQEELKLDIKKIGISIDEDIKPKIEALFDGYKANTEKLELLDDKIDNMQVDVNNLTMKTLNNDNKIIELSKNLKTSTFKREI